MVIARNRGKRVTDQTTSRKIPAARYSGIWPYYGPTNLTSTPRSRWFQTAFASEPANYLAIALPLLAIRATQSLPELSSHKGRPGWDGPSRTWCCWTGSNCRPLPSSRFRFRGPFGSRAGPSLHHRFRRTLRCRPSGLYTFPACRAWLGIGVGHLCPLAFPEFERFALDRFRSRRQLCLPRECSTTELQQLNLSIFASLRKHGKLAICNPTCNPRPHASLENSYSTAP